METIVKSNLELSHEEANQLFDMFLDNMKKFAEMNKVYSSILTDEYRKKWIDNTLDNNNNKIIMFYDNNLLIGFIVVEENDTENFIRDFQIVKSHQNDGETFKNMIIEGVKRLDTSKEFSGDIWMFNSHSRDVFKHIGAKFEDGKYRLSFDLLKKWL